MSIPIEIQEWFNGWDWNGNRSNWQDWDNGYFKVGNETGCTRWAERWEECDEPIGTWVECDSDENGQRLKKIKLRQGVDYTSWVRDCPDGYYDDNNGNWTRCPTGWDTCENADRCTSWSEGYIQYDDNCIENRIEFAKETATYIANSNMISSSASTTTNSIANVMVDPGVSQTSGTSTVTAKGANTPQMFWITLNNYQMLVMFLLLKIRFHESLRELLESMNLSTFTLNIVSLPGIEQIKDAIVKDSNSSKSGHI